MKENVKVVEMGEMAKKGHKRLMFILHEWQIQIRQSKKLQGGFLSKIVCKIWIENGSSISNIYSTATLLTQTLCHVRIEADGDEK